MTKDIDLEHVVQLRESDRLEMKSAAALQKMDSIGRSVVSLLNAAGGEVWIGIREKDEKAVGVENVEDARRELRRLEDYLVDSIEPSPSMDEIDLQEVRVRDSSLLRIEIRPGHRKPYAQLKNGSWRYYPVRVGARTRAMTRAELRDAFAHTASEAEGARREMDRAWDEEITSQRRQLWLRLATSHPPPLEDDRRVLPLLNELLHSPERSGNRTMGWNFCSELEQFEPTPQGYRAGGIESYTWTEVGLDGSIVFRAPINRLEHKEENELYGLALVEYPISICRLASTLYAEVGVPGHAKIWADLGVSGLSGKTLRPGSPGSIAYELEAREALEDSLRAGTRELTLTALREAPDRVGWVLVRRIYAGFGIPSNRMPMELYDEERGQITFPR